MYHLVSEIYKFNVAFTYKLLTHVANILIRLVWAAMSLSTDEDGFFGKVMTFEKSFMCIKNRSIIYNIIKV